MGDDRTFDELSTRYDAWYVTPVGAWGSLYKLVYELVWDVLPQCNEFDLDGVEVVIDLLRHLAAKFLIA